MGRKRDPEANSGAPGWRTWLGYGALLAGVLAGLAGLTWLYFRADDFLATDPRFALTPPSEEENHSGLEITGVQYASRSRIRQVFALDFGRSIYRIPLQERLRSLLEIEWVRSAAVRRRWPNRLEVHIVERTPVAFVQLPPMRGQGPAEVALIDADGVLLPLPGRAQFHLPVLKGIRRDQDLAARRARVSTALKLLAEAQPVSEHFVEIDVSDPNDLKLMYDHGGRMLLLHLGKENFESRLRNFLAHYDQIQQRKPDAANFDLRLDDRITVIEEVAGRG
jgi:cell division septal protein FtsQ